MATMAACEPKRLAMRVIRVRVGNGGGVNADLIGAGIKNRAGIVQRTNASAHGERNEKLSRRPPDGFEEGGAVFVRGRYIEQHDFIRARSAVRRRQFRRIASVTQIEELHALDHASGVHVETSDDAFGQHELISLTVRCPLHKSVIPSGARNAFARQNSRFLPRSRR